jgi:hypothetical protein
MTDKKHEMKLKVTEGKKIIEVPKFQVSVFNSLLKNITRYCKYLKLPQPEVKELDNKTYYAIQRRNPDGTVSVLRGTITDNFDEIKSNIDKRDNKYKSFSIISQDVNVYEINIVEEIKPENEWEILGVIDHNDGIITSAPNKQVPFKLIPNNLHDSSDCDHCNTKRFRNKTIYVKNTKNGEIKRVGGTCIRYYLGYDYERILNIITNLNLFNSTFSDVGGGWDDDDWFGGFGGRSYNPEDEVVGVNEVVKYFFWFVENKGYTSKAAAERYNAKVEDEYKHKNSTSQDITKYLRYIYVMPIGGGKDAQRHFEIWENDVKEFNEIIKKAPTGYLNKVKKFINDNYKDNNFLVNSRNFFNSGSVTIKHLRFVVSACSMYWGMKLAEDRRNEKTKELKKSEYVGEVGEKTPLKNLTIQSVSGFEGSFGWTNIYRLTDDNGNIYTKFGTINPRFINDDSPVTDISKGAIVSFTAEIKKHDTYKDIKQTVLGRLSKI